MNTRKTSLTAAALAPLIWLAGCGMGGGEFDDYYQPAMHYERYPIEVAKGAVRLDVSTRRAELSARQKDSIARFAQQAVSTGASRVEIQSSSAPQSERVAEQAAEIMVANGVAPEAIVTRTGSGGRGGSVILTFDRKIAVTAECGDWPEDIAITYENTPPANFGCATQHNIAAVVANPEDFETPRTETPSDAMRRNQVFVDYRTPKSTATSVTESDTQTVSNVAE
ncbi:MAG TPA: CpaD family pilus assembly protein [Aestuariivirgaceae bacterium]|jgi:pilus assembly protein CpaD